MTAPEENQIIACTVQVNTTAKHRLLFVSTKHGRQRVLPHLTLSWDILHNGPFYQSVALFCFCVACHSQWAQAQEQITIEKWNTQSFFLMLPSSFLCPAADKTTEHPDSRPLSFSVYFCLSAVWGLLKSILSPGEPQDPPQVPHWGEAICVRTWGLQQGLF